MIKELNVVIEKDAEGFFVASVPSLKGCHTQAKSLDILMERIREAASLCLEVEGLQSEELEFVGIQKITLEV
ncbi:MAG: type II toxin-antitoxin system HicB family antitoxin [Chloroflexaceae bacterium]|nr:type II toxin-antitoxin system HicB family antitoxin [Chloroflexaceae bacterium]